MPCLLLNGTILGPSRVLGAISIAVAAGALLRSTSTTVFVTVSVAAEAAGTSLPRNAGIYDPHARTRTAVLRILPSAGAITQPSLDLRTSIERTLDVRSKSAPAFAALCATAV